MVGAPGIEPGTSAMSRRHSNHLSYAPGSIVSAQGGQGSIMMFRCHGIYGKAWCGASLRWADGQYSWLAPLAALLSEVNFVTMRPLGNGSLGTLACIGLGY